MGNCQAIDNATIAIQYPNGRVDNLYCPVPAGEIMRLNPGHYVALLLTTTLYSSAAAAPAAAAAATTSANNSPLRITRIKLLRPSDTLALGHVYRLVTSQEVMKGLWAKKQGQMQKNGKMLTAEQQSSYFEAVVKGADVTKTTNQGRPERHRARPSNSSITTPLNSTKAAASAGRTWQPALKSISESLA